MYDIVEGDDVFMLEFFHQTDLSDGSGRGALFGVEVDLFQSDQFASLSVSSFIHLVIIVREVQYSEVALTYSCICALAQLLHCQCD